MVALLLAVTAYGNEIGITAANSLNFVFIDNQAVPLSSLNNSGSWNNIDRVPFDPYARVIAIRGNNIQGGCSGLMVASFNTPSRIVSNKDWRCSSSPANGWQFMGFDDSGSDWHQATEVAFNGEIVIGCQFFIIQEMPTDAYWIWTPGYRGEDQIASCRGYTTVCDDMPCKNGGTCNMDQELLCSCPVRYTGKFCESDFDECESRPCGNNGHCEPDDSHPGYTCRCDVGYTGVHCETDTTDCASNPCQHEGTCNFDIEGGYTCACNPGYTGQDCETDIDDCLDLPCENGATCEDLVNDVACHCAPGFEGRLCDINIDECESSPCLSASTCEDLDNGYACHCHPGYTGDRCETGLGECASSPCQNGGTCTLGGVGGSIQCICTPGWSGPICSSNNDECFSSPCKNGGTCVDGEGDYDCFCSDAFTGKNCEFVIPNCGSIMATSLRSPTHGFDILCEINIVNHASHLETPCDQLIRGINYFNDADTILAQGGTFGCFATRFAAEVDSACVAGYNQKYMLGDCQSCTQMGVCLKLPPSPSKFKSFHKRK